ncbi:unnamed protein product [Thlaspi arvense]|uniref:Uncharacterized protein n=1 Tax=Thlaspi arvense TaxID=13288 RepID=A0AAU9SN56_THLAR|nr:unnamed protein product [Thlaspi arvense]
MKSDKIATIVKAAGVEIESYWPMLFAKMVEKRNVTDLIMNVGVGGGGGGAPVAAAAPAAAGGAASADLVIIRPSKAAKSIRSDSPVIGSSFESSGETRISAESDILRRTPRSIYPTRRNSASSSSLRPLPLPSLFAGVRSNVKPGTALAVAVAASRLVPTLHAAIIKSRRASSVSSELLQEVLGAGESVSNQDEEDQQVLSSNSIGDSAGVATGSISVDDFRSLAGESRLEDEDNEVALASQENEAKVREVQASDITETLDYEANSKPDLVTAISAEQEATTTTESGNTAVECQNLNDSDGKCFLHSQSDDAKVNTDEDSSVGDVKKDDSDIIIPDSKEEAGGDFVPHDGSSMSGISELVEKRISELEKERINNREKLKSRSFRKQLVLAEEFEKKQAYTGAAAQPMRLEGIKIGSTNLGYFDVDANNIITRTISWQAFKRDHGSP